MATPTRLPLSAFIICKNEAHYIEPCIRSLDLCAEIIVVDSGSTDGTLDLLERLREEGFPIKVFQRGWPGYAAQKQFALEQCTQPWCLNIDADERLDLQLREHLPRLLAEDEAVAWRIRRRPFLVGFGYTPTYVFERPNLRLVRRGAGAYDLSKRVHEGISVEGRVKSARPGSLLHFRPLPLDEQILKENAYSTLKADQLFDQGEKPRWAKLVFNPPYYFLRLYFGRWLFLCGWAGFIQAMTGAVYSFMTEAKIWQRHALIAHPSKEPPLDGI
ncbi:glycosyltransferase family 2 protein [Flaviflagellibacter deserti]|uniref:Glycosyltransferase family 2 protein n=1 Tax=Flaviflagellibacter deserti TaxID=2267266 RepID=A0ABV9Z8Q7_9HYPH